MSLKKQSSVNTPPITEDQKVMQQSNGGVIDELLVRLAVSYSEIPSVRGQLELAVGENVDDVIQNKTWRNPENGWQYRVPDRWMANPLIILKYKNKYEEIVVKQIINPLFKAQADDYYGYWEENGKWGGVEFGEEPVIVKKQNWLVRFLMGTKGGEHKGSKKGVEIAEGQIIQAENKEGADGGRV